MTRERKPLPRVAGYRVLRRIGRGGMGEVWLADHLQSGRRVALKLLLTPENDTVLRRFQKEAVASLNLVHENIVAGVDIGDVDGQPYIAMEYVPGQTLLARVTERGPLPEDQAVSFALQAASGLGAAARQGVVHRDVKPGNLILGADGKVKVLDFGLVSLSGGKSEDVLAGTIRYMAPEQFQPGETVDHRSDIYSLGLTLFFALTGHHLLEGRLVTAHPEAEAVAHDLRRLRPGISDGLCRVIQRMTEREPTSRYRVWEELIIDLEHVDRGEQPFGAMLSAASQLRRRKWILPVAVGLVTAIVALVVLSPDPVPDPDPRRESPRETTRPREEPEAQALVLYAEKLLEEEPGDTAKAIEAFREVGRRFPDSPSAAVAARRIEALTRKVEVREDARLESVVSEVTDFLSRNEFDLAGQRVVLARRRLRGQRLEERLAELEKTVLRRAQEYVDSVISQADRLVESGDPAAAANLLKKATKPVIGSLGQRIEGRRAALETAMKEARAERRAAWMRDYDPEVVAALGLGQRGKWKDARERLAAAVPKEAGPEFDTLRDLDARILDGLESAVAAAARGAKGKAGRPCLLVRNGKVRFGRIRDVSGATGVRLEPADEILPIAELDSASVCALAGTLAPGPRAALAVVRGEKSVVERLSDKLPTDLRERCRALVALFPASPRPERPGVPPPVDSKVPGRDPARGIELRAQGLDAYVLGQAVEAVGHFRAALHADPFNGEAHLDLARVLLEHAGRNRSPFILAEIRWHLLACRTYRPDLGEAKRLLGLLE